MTSRPELQAPPEIFYNDDEARKYTSSSRIIEIQAKLSERALELLALPNDGVPRLLLDIVEMLAILTEQVGDSKWAITAAGGIPSLVHLLEVGSQKAREDAANILWNLCCHRKMT